MCRKLFKFEIIGIFVVFIIGTIWHNIYEFLGENIIVGMVAPVNESIWEHWKLGLLPMLIYGGIEYKFVKDEAQNFLFSKFIGIIILLVTCFGIIELWHIFFKNASFTVNMIVDICAYFIGVMAGQMASYIIACKTKSTKILRAIAFFGIIVQLIVFIAFTFNPPKLDYFKDSTTGQYGINQN